MEITTSILMDSNDLNSDTMADRVEKDQFNVGWEPGYTNMGD
jgi:hypothetical protein